MIELPRLILASASSRRAEILRSVGWPFEALPVNISEAVRPSEDAANYVQRLAREKAEAAAVRLSGGFILGADTTVALDEYILEKPVDAGDAARMLRLLSGRWHQVLTGVALINSANSETRVACEVTAVKFSRIDETEIDAYVGSQEPMDKAGAYAIQGGAALFIEEIRGDYFNVVGLPVRLVYRLLKELTR